MYKRKKCTPDDIWVIRDFLKETMTSFGEKVNWHLDRLNFTYSMSRCMNGISEEKYREMITMYYDDDKLIAVLLTEGEDRGEAFIEISDFEMDSKLVKMIFDDLEALMLLTEKDLGLRLSSKATVLIEEALIREYTKVDWSEVTMKKLLAPNLDDRLPEGYHFGEGTAEMKAVGHGHAFGYIKDKSLVEKAVLGLEQMKNMLDFEPVLDINVLNEHNEIVAFATMWYDDVNKVGTLEPVGTHPDHRKKGLAKRAIYRACNLIINRGATAVYVGSEQEFYKKIGFSPISTDNVYKKSIKCN